MNFRSCSKGAEGGYGVLQIQHLGVAIVLVIHIAQAGVVIQHGLLGFYAVILHQFSGNAQPHAVLESANLALGVGGQLFGHGLGLAGLDIQLALENVGRAEGADAGLVTLHGGQVVWYQQTSEIRILFAYWIPPQFLTYFYDAYIIQK